MTVIYQDDAYGQEAKIALLEDAKRKEICIENVLTFRETENRQILIEVIQVIM